MLLVDGLDEDRGVTSSPDAHSIAALLPAAPPAGVRVIVAGRPDPPVPADVPQWHPLRDKEIVRPLSVSPRAQMVRDDAERELGHLLDDRGLGRKLLGLVTVAGGGLSSDDLAELTGKSPWTVDKTLRSVLGRTFHGRLNRWRISTAPVFVLAHEELQQSAARNLSRNEVAGLLDQLHDWADRYRKRGWPAETPEYLLRGYHRLLVAIGDIERMTALATDRARLDRMLDVSGGDVAALAEITAVQEFICGQDHPDLAALLNLTIARDRLTQRNSNIPPARHLCARLGNPARAEALARSITDLSGQAQALADVAGALAEAGDLDRARQVVQQAEAIARSVTSRSEQAQALAVVARALARAGDLDEAEAIARSITDPSEQARRWRLWRGHWPERVIWTRPRPSSAPSPARSSRRGRWRLWRGHWPGRVMWTRPRPSRARSPTRPGRHGRWLLWRGRWPGRVTVDQAEAIARSITDPSEQAWALAVVAEALARAGDVDQAEAIARSITDPSAQAWALAAVAEALARAGDVDQAEAIARSITARSRRRGRWLLWRRHWRSR